MSSLIQLMSFQMSMHLLNLELSWPMVGSICSPSPTFLGPFNNQLMILLSEFLFCIPKQDS
jgi:hypothetical protein